MPARQDQTLQIFLIILIFVSIVLMVATYLGFKSYGDANTRATGLQGKLDDSTKQVSNLQTDTEDLREMMGFGRNDNTPAVKDAFKSDMTKMGGGIPDETGRSYRKVLETVYAELQSTAAREADLKEKLKERDQKLDENQKESEAKVAQFEAATKKAQEELGAERNRFAEDRKQLESTKTELQKTLEQQRATYEKQIVDQSAQIKTLTSTLDKREREYRNLREQVKDEPGNFEVADGRISFVNPNGTVWINLGTADSLRRQVSFSVYDADQHDAAKATKKASIEVTRLMGEHLAEARITDERPTNPVMTGDRIYSQVWHRGKKLHFALTGIIDFDGDGRPDLQTAKELIGLNDGVVDAHVTDQGKVEGEISANTHYLVLGDVPNLPTQTEQLKAWNNMNRDADSLGVKKITLHDFLNQMGYKPEDRSVQLGKGATAHDFPPRTESGPPAPPVQRFRLRPPVRTPASPASPATETSPK